MEALPAGTEYRGPEAAYATALAALELTLKLSSDLAPLPDLDGMLKLKLRSALDAFPSIFAALADLDGMLRLKLRSALDAFATGRGNPAHSGSSRLWRAHTSEP